jgi:uncharacterized protein YyaL (SSP411 family)
MARVYLHLWQVTGEPFFRTIVEETLDYVAREMTSPEGGFYSTQDADSEGEEAKFFVWTPDEARAVLGDQADPFLSAYEVTERGNFEGKNILELVGSLEERGALAEAMIEPFRAPEGFYDTSDDHETLIVRPRELQDNAVPSGNGMAALVFLRLAGLAVEPRYLEIVVNLSFPLSILGFQGVQTVQPLWCSSVKVRNVWRTDFGESPGVSLAPPLHRSGLKRHDFA